MLTIRMIMTRLMMIMYMMRTMGMIVMMTTGIEMTLPTMVEMVMVQSPMLHIKGGSFKNKYALIFTLALESR